MRSPAYLFRVPMACRSTTSTSFGRLRLSTRVRPRAAASWYLHAVEGRDREIAKRLSELAGHGDAARLPRVIYMQ
ncbi:hypothetical protein [Nocardia alni]|uniref:hypothetical protein n=1 Tax=Nocardia alni TaxID=2815723 RepID=UPI001C244070|nr:hypothetical protein [Nocardia alni]